MSDILLHLAPLLAASLLYALLGWHFWQTRWHRPAANAGAVPTMRGWERLAILSALLLQGTALYNGLFGAGGMRFSFSVALSLTLWLAVLIYWLESFRASLDGLQAMVLPLAAACAALPLVFPQLRVIDHADAWGFRFHFFAAMLAYGLFTLSALHAVFMAIVERRLRARHVSNGLGQLPPLLAMEALLFRMITVGFLLLTVALASAFFFPNTSSARRWRSTTRRCSRWPPGQFSRPADWPASIGWRGRIAMRWTLAGFVALLLAYIGSRFVSEVLLGRI